MSMHLTCVGMHQPYQPMKACGLAALSEADIGWTRQALCVVDVVDDHLVLQALCLPAGHSATVQAPLLPLGLYEPWQTLSYGASPIVARGSIKVPNQCLCLGQTVLQGGRETAAAAAAWALAAQGRIGAPRATWEPLHACRLKLATHTCRACS